MESVSSLSSLFETGFFAGLLRRFFGKFSVEAGSKIKTAGKWVLGILLLASIFVPRLSLRIGGNFRFDLRTEDFLLLLLLSFFISIKNRPALTPSFPFVEKAFIVFFLAAGVSIVNGLLRQTLDKPLISIFYLLKWCEYFLVFVLAAFFASGRENSRFLLKIFFILGLALAFYGYREAAFPSEQVPFPNYYRLYERFPFYGDANHVSGVIVLWISFFTGLYLKSTKPLKTGILAAGLLLVFPPFLLTYSRKSYFALAAALAPALFIKGSRRRLIFLALSYALIMIVLPSRVLERVGGLGDALASTDPYNSSWAHNVESWTLALWNFSSFWLFGAGFGARHRIFYECQYLMVLTETGILGLISYLALMFSPVYEAVKRRFDLTSPEAQGIAIGWCLGFAGMLVHNISCISGSIVKVAVPYWFLTGVVLSFLASEKKA